ncbi:MAG: heliorhodopsin HeR [Candidatus Saccharimonadales bacterium]
MLNIFKPLFDKKSKISNESLKKWNLTIASLSLVQGGLILFLSAPYNLPVTMLFSTNDTLQSRLTGGTVTAPAVQQLFTINLIYLPAAFFLISAVAHLLAATKYKTQYEAGIKKGINKLRWIEYALSSGIMLIVVGLLAGMYDIGSLLLIFVLAVIACLVGLMLELDNRLRSKKTKLEPFSNFVGAFAGVIPWLIIAFYLCGTSTYGSGVAPYVYGVYGSTLLLFAAIALNFYLLRNKKARWADYLWGERWYMGLSLAAKSLLAWLVFIYVFHS